MMHIGVAFWILMLLWLIFGVDWMVQPRTGIYKGLLVFCLLFLLGWRVFGFILHN